MNDCYVPVLWPNFRLEFLHSILNLISPGINQVSGVSISVNISFWIHMCAEIFASKHRVHEHQKLENFENSQTSRNWSENWFLSTYELRKRSRVLAARIFNMTRRAVSRRVIPIQRVTWPSLGLDFFNFSLLKTKGFQDFISVKVHGTCRRHGLKLLQTNLVHAITPAHAGNVCKFLIFNLKFCKNWTIVMFRCFGRIFG